VVLSGGEAPYVIVEGERWKARTAVPLQPGDRVRVVRIDGLVLDVEALERKPERKE
jgi:membrane-bound ClpP family serine protease